MMPRVGEPFDVVEHVRLCGTGCLVFSTASPLILQSREETLLTYLCYFEPSILGGQLQVDEVARSPYCEMLESR